MHARSLISFAAAMTIVVAGLIPMLASADTQMSPQVCDQLFNLPQGTITTAASSQYLNAQTCGDYQYLVNIYNPGNCSTVGFSNAKVQGITSLNPQFAQELANMLKAASAAGYTITINSAFRTVQGEECANPRGFGGNSSQSMHTKGLAADLQYPNDGNSAGGCDSGNYSAAYQWVAANAKNYGIGLYDQLHSHVNGECNHVEAGTPVAGGIGPGGGGSPGSQTQTSGVLGATQNPLLSSQPSSSYATNPFSTNPIIAASPSLQAVQSCIPEYSCINNAVYYESSACTQTIFQQCQYGCSGMACLPAPTSSTTTVATSAIGTQQTTPPAVISTGPLATSASLTINNDLTEVVQESPGTQTTPSPITTIATGSGQQYTPEVGQSTFSSSGFSSTDSGGVTSSPLLQLLADLRSVLISVLNHL